MKTLIERLAKRWYLLLLLVVALANSGCLLAAGGAAAGAGAAGYAYYRGNVTQRFDTDFGTAWSASHDALYDLGMPIKKETRDAMSGSIETENARGERIRISLEQELPKIPNDVPKTDVGVRVATFGDQDLSRRILEQIATRAGKLPPQDLTPPASQAASQASWKPPPR